MAGIVVALAGVLASFAQYRAAKEQAEVAIRSLQPQIEVTVEPEKDSTRGRIITVNSEGGPLYNLSVDQVTWFVVRKYSGEIIFKQRLSRFFQTSQQTGKIRGHLATLKSAYWPNGSSDQQFSNATDVLKSQIGDDAFIDGPFTLLRVGYVDGQSAARAALLHPTICGQAGRAGHHRPGGPQGSTGS